MVLLSYKQCQLTWIIDAIYLNPHTGWIIDICPGYRIKPDIADSISECDWVTHQGALVNVSIEFLGIKTMVYRLQKQFQISLGVHALFQREEGRKKDVFGTFWYNFVKSPQKLDQYFRYIWQIMNMRAALQAVLSWVCTGKLCYHSNVW